MRSTKDQLVKKDVLMPVKHNVFLWNLPDVEEVPSHDGENGNTQSLTTLINQCVQLDVQMLLWAPFFNDALTNRARLRRDWNSLATPVFRRLQRGGKW
ncbi:hypothetical protein TNCV_160981 [Trichonephila clavipes]|nr:hypothetical protein TNCV_160981 [Trichonephila clavipes]